MIRACAGGLSAAVLLRWSGGLSAAILLTWAAVFAAPAAAHAIVVESTPSIDAVMKPDFDIRIRFNSRIDHKRSRLAVLDAAGAARPAAQSVEEQPPELLVGHVAGLPAGSYRVRWQVLAVDGHITRGDIPFRVGE